MKILLIPFLYAQQRNVLSNRSSSPSLSNEANFEEHCFLKCDQKHGIQNNDFVSLALIKPFWFQKRLYLNNICKQIALQFEASCDYTLQICINELCTVSRLINATSKIVLLC